MYVYRHLRKPNYALPMRYSDASIGKRCGLPAENPRSVCKTWTIRKCINCATITSKTKVDTKRMRKVRTRSLFFTRRIPRACTHNILIAAPSSFAQWFILRPPGAFITARSSRQMHRDARDWSIGYRDAFGASRDTFAIFNSSVIRDASGPGPMISLEKAEMY